MTDNHEFSHRLNILPGLGYFALQPIFHDTDARDVVPAQELYNSQRWHYPLFIYDL